MTCIAAFAGAGHAASRTPVEVAAQIAMQAVAPPVSCLSPGIGAPSCASGEPLGSVVDPARAGLHVGNPIELASGNKYQRDVEYRDIASGLAVVRHYNSLLIDEDVGLGPGWRHGFQASLGRLDAATLQLVQADGRRVAFRRLPGSVEPEVYRGPSLAFGTLHTRGGRTSWHPGDGRRLDFVGPTLARIDFADARDGLNLLYAGGRLAEVRSDRGRSLRFRYVARSDSLPAYGDDTTSLPAGALEAIELPDGGTIRYGYDRARRLIASELPGDESIRYGYDDPSGLALLTSRRGPDARDERRWRYDGDGLAIASSGAAGLEIRRTPIGPDGGTAELAWHDGRRETLAWTTPADLAARTRPDGTAGGPSRRARPFDELVRAALSGLEAPARTQDRPARARARTPWETVLPLGGRRVRTSFTTDRHGTIDDLRVGGADAGGLLLRWGFGELSACPAHRRPGAASASARLTAVALGARPCADDALLLASFQRALQFGALDGVPSGTPAAPGASTGELVGTPTGPPPRLAPRRGVRPGVRKPRYPRQPKVPRPEAPDPCAMPSNKGCTEVRADLEMAYLSECAYAKFCRSRWTPVKPQEVGLDVRDFHLDGFDAELYRDPGTGAYTLSFRGTDSVGDDWDNNFDQGRGLESRQYELAYRLAGDLRRALPGTDLSFTGHSLGGGLATFAAIRTQADATVFNAAPLHPTTAAREGLLAEYDAAAGHVEVLTTWSDPVTEIGRRAHNAGLYEGRVAPGVQTVLADPHDDWVGAWPHNWVPAEDSFIYHSIAAVIESLETTLEKHCGRRR